MTSFYEEWDRIFGAVYGEKLEKAEKAAEETAKLYQMAPAARLKPLLFAIHTYYALLMKLIAHELLALQEGFGVRSFAEGVGALSDGDLKEKLGYLESGSDFNALGIVNFLEADFFSWYLDTWSSRMAVAARGMVRALADFEPATPVLAPEWTRDLLQKLYELLVPRGLRHGLGEYYTPDWLAGYLVDRSGYSGSQAARFLDPACGSGTFLVQAIRRASAFAARQPRARIEDIGKAILNNIAGFDLNPLAVLAARTNYLIAFAKFLPYVRPFSIPVYLCDSVVPPERRVARQSSFFEKDAVVFRAGEHDYVFPLSIERKEHIDRFCSLVTESLRSRTSADTFGCGLAKTMKLPQEGLDRLAEVYRHIKRLDDEKRDGIWAHYIKNAFAPIYVGRFDFVVGNPPWIRWGYLSGDYRQKTLKLWHSYGLFSLKGHQTRLGAGEKDFSMLFTYACADRYLKTGGTLAFVITGEVFKSKGAGEGFRRFRIGDDGPDLKALWMEDMIDLQPFQAANKTTIFAFGKGKPTTYPVRVTEWTKTKGAGRIAPELSLEEVLARTDRRNLHAVPVDPAKRVSSWQTASRTELERLGPLKGRNAYGAILGARVEPYGVFWLNVLEQRPDRMLVVENQHERGKETQRHVRTAQRMEAAVLGKVTTPFGRKEVISTDTTSFMVARSKEEAHYLCAVLNSVLVNDYIASFSEAGRGFGAPSIMLNLAIPKFEDAEVVHRKLSDLSQEAHQRVERGKPVDDLDEKVNLAARELWNIRS